MHVHDVKLAGTWDTALERDQVLVDFDRRFRRRYVLQTVTGRDVLLDLPQAMRLRDGDGLVLADGGVVRVCARAEALHEVTAADEAALVRIAWHLGNRHLPVQFVAGRIRIRADHVIANMVAGLDGTVADIAAPFDPEAGAYAAEGPQHHHNDDGHDDEAHGHGH